MPAHADRAELSATGIAGLDDILGGGFNPRRLYLLEGDPGSGKTTLSLQYLLEGVRNKEKCLYITLSETREELTAGAVSHGWSLDGIEILEMVADESDLDGDSQLTMFSPSEVELTTTTKRILDAVVRVNPSRVVFDSLSELRLLAQSSLRYRRQILALKHFFLGRNCTVLLLDDHTSEGSDLQLQSIAHGVVALDQQAPLYGDARRRLRIFKLRGAGYRGGFHDFSIKKGGLVVYPRLVAGEHTAEFPSGSIKSGIAALDNLLGGGLERGTSTLLMGPAGAGKSTIAVKYAVAASERGDHSAIFAFDEDLRTLKKRTESLGIRFEQGSRAGQVKLRQINPAEMSPGEFVDLVRESVERDRCTVVIIDSVNGYLNAMPDEKYLISQLHQLLSYLGHRGVSTIIVAAEHGLIGDGISSSIDVSYLADSVVLFRYFEYAGKIKKAISVVKKRSGPHENSIRELKFNAQGIELGELLTDLRGVLTGVPIESDPQR